MKSIWKAAALGSAIMVGCTACMPAGTMPPDYSNMSLVQLEEPEDGTDMAVVTTNYGTFKFVLYDDYAPNAVANFKALVEDGFYENNAIYAINHDSALLTAGASNEDGSEGVVIDEDGNRSTEEEDKIEVEASTDLWHFTGAVSMFGIEKGTLSTTVLGDSRFFVVGYSAPTSQMADELGDYNYPEAVIEAYKRVGGQPIYTGAYTVFGQIVEGYDVIDAIVSAKTEEQDGASTDIPAEELTIENITLTTYSSDTVDYESPEEYASRRAEEEPEEDDSQATTDSFEDYYASILNGTAE